MASALRAQWDALVGRAWPVWGAALLVATVNVFLFAFDRPWTASDGLRNWGDWVLTGAGRGRRPRVRLQHRRLRRRGGRPGPRRLRDDGGARRRGLPRPALSALGARAPPALVERPRAYVGAGPPRREPAAARGGAVARRADRGAVRLRGLRSSAARRLPPLRPRLRRNLPALALLPRARVPRAVHDRRRRAHAGGRAGARGEHARLRDPP